MASNECTQMPQNVRDRFVMNIRIYNQLDINTQQLYSVVWLDVVW